MKFSSAGVSSLRGDYTLVAFFHACRILPPLLGQMAPNNHGRRSKRGPTSPGTPKAIKKLRKEQKCDVNRRIAVELVGMMREGRQRIEPGIAPKIFKKYEAVYGKKLIDVTAVYRYRKEILEGKATSWLPSSADVPSNVAMSQETAVSSIGDDSPVAEAAGHPGTQEPKAIGRPRGTTKAAKIDFNDRKTKALIEAARRYKAAREELSNNDSATAPMLKPRVLEDIIKEVKEEFNLPDDLFISPETIRSRHKRKTCQGKGLASCHL